MTFREFRDVVRLPTDLGVLTTRDKFVKSLLRRKRRRRVVLDIADGIIIIRKYYGSTTTATRRRSPRRCVRAFAHSSSFFFVFFFVWVDDDRKFVERFFSNVFQSIFFLFIGACKCLPFFWWWCSIKYFVCVCVCMGCFSCKNLLKILQPAAAAARTNKYTRGTFFTRSSTTQNSRGFIRVDILEDVLQPLRRARVSLQLCFEFLYAFDDV